MSQTFRPAAFWASVYKGIEKIQSEYEEDL